MSPLNLHLGKTGVQYVVAIVHVGIATLFNADDLDALGCVCVHMCACVWLERQSGWMWSMFVGRGGLGSSDPQLCRHQSCRASPPFPLTPFLSTRPRLLLFVACVLLVIQTNKLTHKQQKNNNTSLRLGITDKFTGWAPFFFESFFQE